MKFPCWYKVFKNRNRSISKQQKKYLLSLTEGIFFVSFCVSMAVERRWQRRDGGRGETTAVERF